MRCQKWQWRRTPSDHGRLAQLVEHLVYTERVGSSSLSSPTMIRIFLTDRPQQPRQAEKCCAAGFVQQSVRDAPTSFCHAESPHHSRAAGRRPSGCPAAAVGRRTDDPGSSGMYRQEAGAVWYGARQAGRTAQTLSGDDADTDVAVLRLLSPLPASLPSAPMRETRSSPSRRSSATLPCRWRHTARWWASPRSCS